MHCTLSPASRVEVPRPNAGAVLLLLMVCGPRLDRSMRIEGSLPRPAILKQGAGGAGLAELWAGRGSFSRIPRSNLL